MPVGPKSYPGSISIKTRPVGRGGVSAGKTSRGGALRSDLIFEKSRIRFTDFLVF